MSKYNVKVLKKSNCVGCSNCAEVCPTKSINMRPNIFGFNYPRINNHQCLNCGLCVKVCPSLNICANNNSSSTVYGGKSLDELLRSKSSSGGLFGEIAKEIIKSKGAVYAAAYDSHFNVNHIRVVNLSDLDKLLGSKYVQSNLQNIFKSIKKDLEENKEVFFVGLPCQNAALKCFLGPIDVSNLYCADLVCHGVGAPKILREYLSFLKYKHKKKGIKSINSRDKTTGWSKYSYCEKVVFDDGSEFFTPNNKSLFFRLFGLDIILRKSCFECRFKGLNRYGDLTLGDFWGLWEIDSLFDDNKGISLILVNNSKGEKLISRIKDALIIKRYDLDESIKYNPSIVKPVIKRTTFKKTLVKITLSFLSLLYR